MAYKKFVPKFGQKGLFDNSPFFVGKDSQLVQVVLKMRKILSDKFPKNDPRSSWQDGGCDTPHTSCSIERYGEYPMGIRRFASHALKTEQEMEGKR